MANFLLFDARGSGWLGETNALNQLDVRSRPIIMVDWIRKQLDELMGEDRNEQADESATSFTAAQHCRYYLCGTFGACEGLSGL